MIHSMTGFASVEQQMHSGRLTWEMRSVNHRYLEIGLRLPEEFRVLEKIPFIDGAELTDQVSLIVSLIENYESPYLKITTELEDAIFAFDEERFQRLIKEVLNG